MSSSYAPLAFGPAASRCDTFSKNSWSPSGIPISRYSTVTGTGAANAGIRSAGAPFSSILSSCRSTISWIIGRMVLIRLIVKLGISILRRVLCAGPSAPTSAVTIFMTFCWTSLTVAAMIGNIMGHAGLVRSLEMRGSIRSRRAASRLVIAQTRRPS